MICEICDLCSSLLLVFLFPLSQGQDGHCTSSPDSLDFTALMRYRLHCACLEVAVPRSESSSSEGARLEEWRITVLLTVAIMMSLLVMINQLISHDWTIMY